MRQDPRHSLLKRAAIAAGCVALLVIVLQQSRARMAETKDTLLHEQLAGLRGAIDQYYGANRAYPPSLDDLVTAHYLSSVPRDPITDRNDSWQVTLTVVDGATGVYDVHSGADGKDRNGIAYASW